MRRTPAVASLCLLLASVAGCDCGDDDDTQPPGPDAGADAAPGDAGLDAEPGLDAAVPPECPQGLGLDVSVALEPGQVRAGRVDDPAALLTGQSADGRVGDFKIYNDQVAFIVQSERLGDNYVPWGGSVIDADLVHAPGTTGGDILDEFTATPGIVALSATCVGVVQDGSTGEAIIRAVGTDAAIPIINGVGFSVSEPVGLIVVNDYRLEPGSSSLQITSHVVNPTRRILPMDVGDFLLLSDDEFDPFDTGPGGMSRATMRPLILGSVGEARHYALGVFADVPLDANYLGIGQLMSDSAGSGDVTIFIYRLTSTGLEQNEEISWTRYLAVGRDVDDIVRERQRIIPGAGDGLVNIAGLVREEGTGEPVAGARVHVVNDDSYASAVMTGADGSWEARVPAGQYRVTATGTTIGEDVLVPNEPPPDPPFAAGRHKSETLPVDATSDVADLVLTLGRPVPLDLTIRDDEGNLVPGKVTFAFPDGTDPAPPDRVLGERNPYSWTPNIFWTSDGHVTGFIEPGSYRVTASSGFDFELDSRDVELTAGTPYVAEFTLNRAIHRDGYVTLDAHLHAGPSIHGEITLEERLVTNLAEGLDAMCASDHDRVVDYGPALARTGLGDRHVVLPSEEISTFLNGHFNPYPVRLRPELPDNGRINWWDGMSVDEMFTEAIDDMDAVVVQINHGGGDSRGAYFNDAGYDPVTGEILHPDRWSDLFNVMELQNGKGGHDNQVPVYFGLLNHGKRVGVTGVSDSHHRIPEAGFARTYVWLGDQEPTPNAIAFAVRDGHTVVSAGPMIFLRVDDGAGGQLREGDTLALDAPGTVHLSIRVEAPSWIPVETVTLIQEGVELETIDVTDGAPVWLDVTRDVPVDQDTWLTVRADGTSDLAPAYSGGEPFAMPGAIFVDVAE